MFKIYIAIRLIVFVSILREITGQECLDRPCKCCVGETSRCRKPDNLCLDGCKDGIWGKRCYNYCPGNCALCTQNSTDRGYACTSCIAGKYGSMSCDKKCPEICATCTIDSKNNGYPCIQCQNKGKYGEYCNTSCSAGCNNGSCNIDGSCTCIAGYSGDKCDVISCPDNCRACYFPTLCRSCVDGYYNDTSGENTTICEHPCSARYSSLLECTKCKAGYDINTNCSECVLNRYGSNCDSHCGNCIINGEQSKCYDNNGTCIVGCQEGFYGNKCDLRCHQNCRHFNCSRLHGRCLYGCQEMFIISGSDCVLAVPKVYVAVLIGSIGGSVVLGVLITVTCCLLIKRRNNEPQCCCVITKGVTRGQEDTTHVYVNTTDSANERVEVTVNADDNESHELEVIFHQVVLEDVIESTPLGNEARIPHHYDNVRDVYEPLDQQQQQQQGEYDELIVPEYENT